jgi:putative endonuclease
MLLCDDGSFYTGYSNNPTSRLLAHMKGQGARYTRMHTPSKIIYLEKHRTRSAAMVREREIKALTHEEKRGLSTVRTKRNLIKILKDGAISV